MTPDEERRADLPSADHAEAVVTGLPEVIEGHEAHECMGFQCPIHSEYDGPVDPALLVPAGTVVAAPPADDNPWAVRYEPAATGATAPIPYEKTDRTPAALQPLEAMTSDLLGIPSAWFVCVAGQLTEHGSVAMFGEVRNLGHPDFRLYRIVSYDGRNGKFTHFSRYERAAADSHYAARIEELS